MNDFIQTLSGVNKVLYKQSYNFHMEHVKGATPESAHLAGLDKLEKIRKISEEEAKPKTYVDLSTGKTFVCTEAELMARHA